MAGNTAAMQMTVTTKKAQGLAYSLKIWSAYLWHSLPA